MCCQHSRNSILVVGYCVAFWCLAAVPASADRIILRSLKILTDRTVVSFDDEGVVLDNQQRLPWYEIEKATIAPDRQAAFDQLLNELGAPLYRIRQRLSTSDYAGVLEPAEAIYPRFSSATTDTAYLVAQSVMWGRMAAGRREEAVEPYLRCFEILRVRKSASDALPGMRRLRFDPETGLTPELTPVWFQVELARRTLPAVFRQIAEMKKPRPDGPAIYYATLAITAGEQAGATRVLSASQSTHPSIVDLRTILDAQLEVVSGKPGAAVAKLGIAVEEMKPEHQSLAWYWLGLSRLSEGSREAQQAGMLQLLRIPAVAGREQPELSAAALFQVMQALAAQGDAAGSIAVRRELLERYGQTYYAVQVRETPTGTEK